MIDELKKSANKIAIKYNHEYVGTEHVLLALLSSDEVNQALCVQGITQEQVESELKKSMHKGPEEVITDEIRLTPRTKKSLEYAIEIAKENERDTVSPNRDTEE